MGAAKNQTGRVREPKIGKALKTKLQKTKTCVAETWQKTNIWVAENKKMRGRKQKSVLQKTWQKANICVAEHKLDDGWPESVEEHVTLL